MTEPGYGEGWFTASRLELAFGPFGISVVSRYDGVMNAGATLQNPAFLDMTSDKDHYTFAYPEIGFGFSYNALYRGTIGFEPVGTGYMTFTANGVTETLFPQGTPASPASWMGWFISREVEISSNN
jgi:hypothetical protein